MTPRLPFLGAVRRALPRFSPPLALPKLRLNAIWSRFRTRRLARVLRPAVEDAQAQLQEFGNASGLELTALTEGIGALDGHLAEVRTQAAGLDVILQDHDEDRALASAFDLFKRSVDLAHASIGIALSQEEQMEQIESRLLCNRDRFNRNSVLFRMLVLNIRTEAARIDPENRAVFASVAADIAGMEQHMSETVAVAFREIEAIVLEAAAGRTQLQSLRADLHERAQTSIKLLRTQLDGIKTGLIPCAATSAEITALLAQTRTQTSELITSLQYQDIVRQQLDHVCAGFADLRAHLQPGSALDLAYLHRAASVQRSHLGASRESIESAGRRIQENSQALLATGAAIVTRFSELEAAADAVFRGANIGEVFKTQTDQLVALADQSESTNLRLSRLLERIEHSVQVFSTGIRRHQFDVLLVSLNGQIAASRVPDAGALNKLAEETSRLSQDTAVLTEAMSAQLNETLARLLTIRQESAVATRTIGEEKRQLAEGSVLVSAKLSRLDARIHQSSGSASAGFTTAYDEVRERLASLGFQALIASAYAPAEAFCEQLLAASARHADQPLSADGAARLAAHQSRYTMRTEHEAHRAAVATVGTAAVAATAVADVELFDASAPVPAAVNVTPPASGESFGDNVELF